MVFRRFSKSPRYCVPASRVPNPVRRYGSRGVVRGPHVLQCGQRVRKRGRFCQRPVRLHATDCFLFATEHLNGSFQFSFPSDEWIVVLQTVIQTSYKVSPGFAFSCGEVCRSSSSSTSSYREMSWLINSGRSSSRASFRIWHAQDSLSWSMLCTR